jgi:hypothetical protein
LAQDTGMVGGRHNLDYLLPACSADAWRPAREPRETAVSTFTCRLRQECKIALDRRQ